MEKETMKIVLGRLILETTEFSMCSGHDFLFNYGVYMSLTDFKILAVGRHIFLDICAISLSWLALM